MAQVVWGWAIKLGGLSNLKKVVPAANANSDGHS